MAAHNFKSVTQLFSESSDAVRRNLGVFILISSLSILSTAWQIGSDLKDKTHGSAWGSIAKNSVLGTNNDYPHIGGGVILVLFFIAGVALALMSTILTLRAAKKHTVTFSEVWEEFTGVWLKLIGVMLLAAILIGFSFVLLIIPGIFVLPRLIMAPYVLLDQKTGVREAISRSWDMTKGRMDVIWYVILFGVVLSLPSIVPILGPIVAFTLSILYSVAMPLRYWEIKANKA